MRYLACMSAAVVLLLGSVTWGVVWDIADYDFGSGKDSFVGIPLAGQAINEVQTADASTVVGETGAYWGSTFPVQIPAPPFTWEFKVAIPVGSSVSTQTRPGLNGGPTSKDVSFQISPDVGTFRFLDGATSAANAATFTLDDPTAFNIFRTIVDASGTGNLYLNDDPTLVATFDSRDFVPGGGHGITLGSNGASGASQWDYMRLATGEHLVPEPASLAILSLGGLMLLRRRR
jgi:hypothetical protein